MLSNPHSLVKKINTAFIFNACYRSKHINFSFYNKSMAYPIADKIHTIVYILSAIEKEEYFICSSPVLESNALLWYHADMMPQEFRFIFLFVLGIFALAFFVLGIMLRHHWQLYSPNQAIGRLFQILYWAIGGTLLLIMAITSFTLFI